MNKGIMVGGIAILAGAAVSAPYFMGNAIETRFSQEVKDLRVYLKQIDPMLDVKQENYKKGWFSSSSQVLITWNGRDVTIDNKITHGPFGYFGLGKIESSIVFDNNKALQAELESMLATMITLGKGTTGYTDNKSPISQLFSGASPLSITSKIGFSNSATIDIYSPAINDQPLPNEPSILVNWGGVEGSIEVKGQYADATIKMPNLKLTQGKEFFDAQNTILKFNGFYGNDLKKWFNVDTSGEVFVNIGKLSFGNDISAFSSKLDLTMNSNDDQHNIGFATTLKLTDIKLPQELNIDVADNNLVEFNLEFTGIPKKHFVDYMINLEELEKNNPFPNDSEFLSIVEPLAVTYMKGTPSIKSHLLIKDSKKNALFSFNINLATENPNIKTLDEATVNLEERIGATLSSKFSESFIDEFDRKGLLPMPKQAFIDNLRTDNRFTLSNGELSNTTEYKKGHFYVNGQPDPKLDESFPYLLEGILPYYY